jgi:hypothetical protein
MNILAFLSIILTIEICRYDAQTTVDPIQFNLKLAKLLRQKLLGEEKLRIDNFDAASLTAVFLTGLRNRNKPLILRIDSEYGNKYDRLAKTSKQTL